MGLRWVQMEWRLHPSMQEGGAAACITAAVRFSPETHGFFFAATRAPPRLGGATASAMLVSPSSNGEPLSQARLAVGFGKGDASHPADTATDDLATGFGKHAHLYTTR